MLNKITVEEIRTSSRRAVSVAEGIREYINGSMKGIYAEKGRTK